MSAKQVLVLLGSDSDFPITEKGLAWLKEWKIPFSLRIASAHRSSEHVRRLVEEFEGQSGRLIICVAGKSAHLAGVVAAETALPVFAVPVAGADTAGFDALLSMCQMPAGVPVATFGFGTAGFANAVALAGRVLANHDRALAEQLARHRKALTEGVLAADSRARMEFEG